MTVQYTVDHQINVMQVTKLSPTSMSSMLYDAVVRTEHSTGKIAVLVYQESSLNPNFLSVTIVKLLMKRWRYALPIMVVDCVLVKRF